MRIPQAFLNTEPVAVGLGRPTRTDPLPAAGPHRCEWKPAASAGYLKCAGCGSVGLAALLTPPPPLPKATIEDGDPMDWYGLDLSAPKYVRKNNFFKALGPKDQALVDAALAKMAAAFGTAAAIQAPSAQRVRQMQAAIDARAKGFRW